VAAETVASRHGIAFFDSQAQTFRGELLGAVCFIVRLTKRSGPAAAAVPPPPVELAKAGADDEASLLVLLMLLVLLTETVELLMVAGVVSLLVRCTFVL
jgi:hypothetical protein